MGLLLSGGGGPVPALDAFFVGHVDRARPVLLVPHADEDAAPAYAGYVEAFHGRFARYGISRAEMALDLRGIDLDDAWAAVFIGGGNTFTLLKAIRESGFDRRLVDYVRRGGLVYGNSAGSIISGRDILATTWDDENGVGLADSSGLNLVHGMDICCHFTGEDNIRYKRERIRCFAARSHGTIALPDDCGLYVPGGEITCVGSGVVWLMPN